MAMQYYRFFPGDYARDTRHLSMMQNGAYRTLIDEYMVHGPLPNDLQRLYRTCSAFSSEERAAVELVLTEYFVLEGPHWHHKRCDLERGWQSGKSDRAVKANKVRWESKGNPPVIQMDSKWNPNQNQNKTTPSAKPGLPAGFAEFWSAYPNKKGKGDAIKAWGKLNPDETLQNRLLQAVARQSASTDWVKDGGQFIPHPATWLNGIRWEDEMAVPAKQRPPVF